MVANGIQKHYYAGSQRIVSRLGDQEAGMFEPPCVGCYKTANSNFDDKKLQRTQKADLQQYADKANKGTIVYKDYKPIPLAEQEKAIADENDDKILEKAPQVVPIYYYHPDHLGTSTALTDFNGNAYQFFLNLPFGETMAQQLGSNYYNSPYKFNGKELDEETGLYYYGARYFDPRISIFQSTDQMAEKYPNVNPYAYCFQNPINIIDPTGMEPDEPSSASKLTGSSNLLVYINEKLGGKDIHGNPNKKLDTSAMKEASGDFDFIAVDNINQVQGVLEGHYGKGNVPEIQNLVVRSHGATSTSDKNAHGPDLNMNSGVGVVNNPAGCAGLEYLESILSNNASIVFTACNAVQDYGTGKGLSNSSRSLAQNYSELFLKGTDRSMYMNWSKSYSRTSTGTNTEMFAFDSNIRKDSYGGYIRFYYNESNVWTKDSNFYNMNIKSGNGWFSSSGIETTIFKPIKK